MNMRKKQEQLFQIILVIATIVMTILRFLMNEKGRVSPDSIRFFRGANVFPVVDNTTTPLGYPISIKFFTLFGFDEFWSSKILGIFAYLFIIFFAWKKKFYYRETIFVGALFSFISIFSYTISEALILPFVFWMIFVARQIIIGEITGLKATLILSASLILLFNIRYNALFFMGGIFLFAIINLKAKYSKNFISAAVIGFTFIIFYKFLFIDTFNKHYVDNFLEIGLKPTSQLLLELLKGLATAFNPFIHMANPEGGFINVGVYGLGAANIALMIFIFLKSGLSETEKFLMILGITGIFCSFFIQYFYSIDQLDYRLLSPFTFPIWLVYFKKIYQFFGRLTYVIPLASISVGLAFTWLSRGNYIENRKKVQHYLKNENLMNGRLDFYIKDEKNLKEIQVAELISTVNANLDTTNKAEDTLKKRVLTMYKVLTKIKIDENKFQ